MTERRRTEERVRSALRDLEAPDEHLAEERGRRVVEAAFAEREPGAARSRTPRRIALALMAAGAIAVLALTPAGAEVREWFADRVDPGEEEAEPRLTSLPTPGSVLVEAPNGAWLIREDGAKRRLGDYDLAAWSPNGRFLGVASGPELRAIDPAGNFRWSIEAPDDVSALDWSSDEGFRVAYLAGNGVRVVAGDGTGDQALAPARPVPPVWRPESDPDAAVHELAYVDPKNRVVRRDTDSGRLLFRTSRYTTPITSLEWSADGDWLLVEAAGFQSLLGPNGETAFKGPLTSEDLGGATISPSGSAVAVVRGGERGSELVIIPVDGGPERTLYRTDSDVRSEQFDAPVFSPDGEWILLPWRAADQWLFVRVEDRRVIAVADIARQFGSPGGRGSFPRVAGWCC